MLTTDQKGAITELAIAHAALKLGAGVLKPLSDGERYDLIFDVRPRLVRVQCKSAVLSGSILKVPCYSARRSANGFLKRYYSPTEIDAIAAYNAELDRCFFIPLGDSRSSLPPTQIAAMPKQSASRGQLGRGFRVRR